MTSSSVTWAVTPCDSCPGCGNGVCSIPHGTTRFVLAAGIVARLFKVSDLVNLLVESENEAV